MRTCVWVMVGLSLIGSIVRGEEKPNPDQLKKAYDDALVQLKAAQDSKNALAKQVGELKRELAAADGRIQDLQRQVSENDEKTFFLRACYAAWQRFLGIHPDLLVQWKLFIGEDALAVPQEPNLLVDPGWLLITTRHPLPLAGSPFIWRSSGVEAVHNTAEH